MGQFGPTKHEAVRLSALKYIYVFFREMHDSEIEEEIREAFRQGDPGTFRDIRRNIPI